MRPHSAVSDLNRLVRDVAASSDGPLTPPQELIADASTCISEGDVLNTCVRRHQVRCTSQIPVTQQTHTSPSAMDADAIRADPLLRPPGFHRAVRLLLDHQF